MSLDEFLTWEQTQSFRYEFAHDHVFAMADPSRAHATITSNVIALIRPAIRGKAFRIYGGMVKLVMPAMPSVRYPDIVVACDPDDLGDEHITRFPSFIAEIVSASTETLDRAVKFAEYQSIDSLREYVLIDSRAVHVEVFRREPGKRWLFEEYGRGSAVFFDAIGLIVPIEALYEDVPLTHVERMIVN